MWGWGFKWSWTADEAHCPQPRQVAAFFLRHCLLFFIHALAVFQILSTSFSRAVIPQLNHFSSEPWPLSCHYTSLSKCKHSSSILFCSHLLSPVYQSFTPLVNALWLTTYHSAETSLAKVSFAFFVANFTGYIESLTRLTQQKPFDPSPLQKSLLPCYLPPFSPQATPL